MNNNCNTLKSKYSLTYLPNEIISMIIKKLIDFHSLVLLSQTSHFFKNSLQKSIKKMTIENIEIDLNFVKNCLKNLYKLKTLKLVDCPFQVQNVDLFPESLTHLEITYKNHVPKQDCTIELTPQLETFIYTDFSKDENQDMAYLTVDARLCKALQYLELRVLKPNKLIYLHHPEVSCLRTLKCTTDIHILSSCSPSFCDGIWLQNMNTLELSYNEFASTDLIGHPFYFGQNIYNGLLQVKIHSSPDLETLILFDVRIDDEFEVVSNNDKQQTTLELILIPEDETKLLNKRLLDFGTKTTHLVNSEFQETKEIQ